MTGPEHYAEAERMIATQPFCMCERTDCEHGRAMVEIAQVHATLALAAATALANYCGGRMTEGDSRRWFEAASAHPEHVKRQREAERAEMEALAKEALA